MNVFKRLFSKTKSQRHKETPSMHTLVTNEIRFLVECVLERRGIATREKIVKESKYAMVWFKIRSRQYGESGSRFGVPEITSNPKDDGIWPTWLKFIPTLQLDDVRNEIYELANTRRPLTGHGDEEGLRRQAICEFSSRLLFKLFDMEKQTRT